MRSTRWMNIFIAALVCTIFYWSVYFKTLPPSTSMGFLNWKQIFKVLQLSWIVCLKINTCLQQKTNLVLNKTGVAINRRTKCFSIPSTWLWDSFISEAIIPSHSREDHKPFGLLFNGYVCSSIISYRKPVNIEISIKCGAREFVLPLRLGPDFAIVGCMLSKKIKW